MQITQILKNLSLTSKISETAKQSTTNNQKVKQQTVETKKSKKESVFSMLNESQCKFAPLGTSVSFPIGNNRKLEHGTTPELMKKASNLLTREFEVNPKKDFARYYQKNRYTYYAVIQSLDHTTTIDCALRVVLDDVYHPRIVVLDFIRTRVKLKGQGLAGLLVQFVLDGSVALHANVYVTSTKEAKTYWERFGFVQEKNKDLDCALNEFKDCTLLSLPSNSIIDLSKFYDSDESTSDDSDSSSEDSDESDDSTSDESDSDSTDSDSSSY